MISFPQIGRSAKKKMFTVHRSLLLVVMGRFSIVLAVSAVLLTGCEPERELESGEQLLDRFWQGVSRDAFGENLDQPTVRDVRRALELPKGCVASFDRDDGLLFVRAPAEELQAVDRRISEAEFKWEGPVQIRLTGSLWISPLQAPNPWDFPQSVAEVLEEATMVDRRELIAFLGVAGELSGREKQPLPPEADGDDGWEDDILRSWRFEGRAVLADDSGNLDVDFRYILKAPKPGAPGHYFHANVTTQCLLALGQPQVFDVGSVREGERLERLVFVIEATRINPTGLPEPKPEGDVSDVGS